MKDNQFRYCVGIGGEKNCKYLKYNGRCKKCRIDGLTDVECFGCAPLGLLQKKGMDKNHK